MRMFDSFLLTLCQLCRQWVYAKSLLRLFEDRDMWSGRERRQPSSAEGEVLQHQPDGLQGGLSDFSLRPIPLSVPDGSGGVSSTSFPSTSLASGFEQSRGPFFPGHSSPVLNFNNNLSQRINTQVPGNGSADVQTSGPPYQAGFAGGSGFSMAGEGDNMDMLPVPSALEFLLAGMGNEYDFLN